MFKLAGKRVLVTGGRGFLGRHLYGVLRHDRMAHVLLYCGDATNKDDTRRKFQRIKPEVVFHLAASVGGIGANRANPAKFFYDNAMMGLNVIDACREFNVEKTIVVGTTCSYPFRPPHIPFRESDLWEGYPEETNAPYGIAKKALLVGCQAYREQYGLNAIYLLPVNLYGP